MDDTGFAASADPDIAWIEPWLAVGGKPYPDQRLAIRELGVETVITLQVPDEGEADAWEGLGVAFVALATTDWIAIPRSRFQEVIEELLAQRAAGRRVLLHCLAGVNRAPTIAAALLAYLYSLSPEEAVRRVRTARPAAAPTHEQMRSLREWIRRSGAQTC